MPPDVAPVSVVIATYNRCEDCKRATKSALEQQPPPLEVLVCDDGSTDDTQVECERWQAREPRLRYLRLEPNRGTPAPARNLGIASARAEWVAFLDDDDRWRAGKLALQATALAAADADVIATDAIGSDGRRYFGSRDGAWRPSRADVERANPIILSSAIARRRLLLEAHGFDESSGVEDYELWLRLADRGARFLVLDVPALDYCDHDGARRTRARWKGQRELLRLRLRRWLGRPGDRLLLFVALRESLQTARMAVEALARRQ
jgi:glycosyltransferase involved in cell wall biosynthesis